MDQFMADNARYIPPILPLPGGFFFSFTQAYKLVKSWNELDPKLRKKQHLDITTQKLDLLIKHLSDKHSDGNERTVLKIKRQGQHNPTDSP